MNNLFYAFLGKKMEAKNAWKYGFNKWDEAWEPGFYGVADGTKVKNNNYIRSANYVPVFPDTEYYFKAPTVGIVLYYDAEKNYIEYKNYFRNGVFKTPNTCHFVTFFLDSGYGTTYKNDVCINLSGDHNGEYVPYNG